MYELKFGDEPLERVLEDHKRTTWRLLSDTPVHQLKPGTRFYALNDDGDRVAVLIVEWIKLTKVSSLSMEDLKYHKRYDNVGEIVKELQNYYPDENVSVATNIAVIRFQKVGKFTGV